MIIVADAADIVCGAKKFKWSKISWFACLGWLPGAGESTPGPFQRGISGGKDELPCPRARCAVQNH